MLDLYHSDEFGCALTLPTCYSWMPVGMRLRVPYEAPQGRRVNGIGAYCTHGVEVGRFNYELCASLPKSKAKKRRRTPEEQAAKHDLKAEQVGVIDGERFVQFIWTTAGRPANSPEGWQRERPITLVIDNYTVHTSERVQEELEAFAAAGITLFSLPSYSPELSGIEPIWNDLKYHRMRKRSYKVLGELYRALEKALARKASDLLAAAQKTDLSLCAAT